MRRLSAAASTGTSAAATFSTRCSRLLAHDPGTLLIPGTRSVEHLAENVAAADVLVDAAALSLRVDR